MHKPSPLTTHNFTKKRPFELEEDINKLIKTKNIQTPQFEEILRILLDDYYTRIKDGDDIKVQKRNQRRLRLFKNINTLYLRFNESNKNITNSGVSSIHSMMIRYRSKFHKAELKKLGTEQPSQVDACRRQVIQDLEKIYTNCPTADTFKSLIEAYQNILNAEEALKQFSREKAKQYLQADIRIYEVYLDLLYNSHDSKIAIFRVKEIFERLLTENPKGICSHVTRKMLELYENAIEKMQGQKNDLLVQELLKLATETYEKIENTKDLKPSQIHKTMLNIKIAANRPFTEIKTFFDRSLKDMKDSGATVLDAHFEAIIKHFYRNYYFAQAVGLFKEAWQMSNLTYCQPTIVTVSPLMIKLNTHPEGKTGGGSQYSSGANSILLPLIIHLLILTTKENIAKLEPQTLVRIEIICGFPSNKKNHDKPVTLNEKPVYERVNRILSLYKLGFTNSTDNDRVSLQCKVADLLCVNTNQYLVSGKGDYIAVPSSDDKSISFAQQVMAFDKSAPVSEKQEIKDDVTQKPGIL